MHFALAHVPMSMEAQTPRDDSTPVPRSKSHGVVAAVILHPQVTYLVPILPNAPGGHR